MSESKLLIVQNINKVLHRHGILTGTTEMKKYYRYFDNNIGILVVGLLYLFKLKKKTDRRLCTFDFIVCVALATRMFTDFRISTRSLRYIFGNEKREFANGIRKLVETLDYKLLVTHTEYFTVVKTLLKKQD